MIQAKNSFFENGRMLLAIVPGYLLGIIRFGLNNASSFLAG